MHATRRNTGGRMGTERARAERGSAMVVSLLVLLTLTMVGVLFFMQAKTETQIAGHDMRRNQAFYNAEAGYGEALARMANANDAANYIGQPQGAPIEPGWGRYIVLSNGGAAGDPDYADTENDGLDNDSDTFVDEVGERYPEVATRQGAGGISYPWVKVRYRLNAANQPVLFGDHDNDVTTPPIPNLVTGTPILVVTARGSQGESNRTVAVEAVKNPFPSVNTAAYSESDDFQFNGTQFLISGRDWDPDTGAPIPGNPEVPAIMTTGDPNNIANELSNQQQNNVEGQGAEPSVSTSPVDLDLQAMAQEYASMAEYNLSAGTYSNVSWGGRTDYTVVNCTGDLHLSGNNSGGGLLIVNGDFDCSGSFIWYGVVLVLGDVTFTGGGSGVHIYGSVLSEGGLDQQVVGGNADILYSSIAISRLTSTLSPYVVASWQEL